ncbi:pentatricopeptide repeat-containing protein At5g14820, mitochondrial-like [Prosopis cineraria]|uniref:pentatricopeptide repeat-containing protein At5g14820, mitochondrial-like n=1 Tax=Prosopis cineraria TaxID=364024 RepID=UPI00240EE4CC|nr:pentatricopeptide repeat-containing protein At5g14820, mitochondrial-like [Prosopis cineraria]
MTQRTPSKVGFLILIYHCPSLRPLNAFYSPKLRAFHQGRPNGWQRSREGKQVCFPCGSSLSLSRMFYSTSNCTIYRSRRQIPFLLPLSPPFLTLQKELLIPLSEKVSGLSTIDSSRAFASGTGGDEDEYSEIESGNDDDDSDRDCDGGGDLNAKSGAHPDEVDRVCKVIDELFALDRNMEAVLDGSGIQLSNDLVVDVLERFKHARKPAFRFFCWAGQRPGFAHNSRTYNSMMNILGKTRQFETMMAILEEMGEKGLLTMETFTIAIKAFAAAKERKKAVGIFDLMKKYRFKVGVDSINFLLDTLGRAKLGKEAQAIFEKLKDRFTYNLQTYTVLLNGWCRVKNLMEAGRLWNEMIDEGFKPDVVAHNIMLEGLLRCKKKSDAIKLFEVMKAKGPLPNVRSYTIVIRDLCKQKMMGEAAEFFHQMIDSGCQPDVAVYTSLITGFGNQKKMEVVYNLLQEMREKGCPPDGRTYNALIKLMTSQHMPNDAMRIYNKMIQNGVEPSIHTYNMIMKSFFVTKKYEMGYAIWDEMCQNGCCPDNNSYTVLIGGLIRQGRSGEACKFLEEMIEKGMKTPQLDYNKFAADFSRGGRPEILEELAQRMKFSGKFEVSNVFSRWAEMMKKRVKRREPTKYSRQFS